MATSCVKCGKEVDTLAKRRHRCRIARTPVTESESDQWTLGFYRGRGCGKAPYLRKSR